MIAKQKKSLEDQKNTVSKRVSTVTGNWDNGNFKTNESKPVQKDQNSSLKFDVILF